MKSLIFFLLFLAGIAAFAQQNPQTQELQKLDKSVKNQLENLLTSYFDLKDAFVETNAKKASEKAKNLLTVLSKVETAKMTAAQQAIFQKESLSLKTETTKISTSQDVEKQRVAFETVSISMLKLVKTFKPNATPVYQQFCPMAFDNKGAFWLSDQKQVLNPYFGNKMLHCGSVKAEY